jgi:hypothetical protein
LSSIIPSLAGGQPVANPQWLAFLRGHVMKAGRKAGFMLWISQACRLKSHNWRRESPATLYVFLGLALAGSIWQKRRHRRLR